MKHLNSIKQCNATGMGQTFLLLQGKLLGIPLQNASISTMLCVAGAGCLYGFTV